MLVYLKDNPVTKTPESLRWFTYFECGFLVFIIKPHGVNRKTSIFFKISSILKII